MRFWDNDKDRAFDEALDEIILANRYIPTDAELDEMALEWERRWNIGNPQKLIGAQ